MSILMFFAAVFAMLIPVAIIALIVVAIINKDKGKDVSNFSVGVKTFYTYIIVITSLFMIVAGTITSVSSLLDYFLPESELEVMENDCKDYSSSGFCSPAIKEVRIRNEKNLGITEFASSIALVLVATILFITHSKEAKRLRDVKIEVNIKEEEKSQKETSKTKKTI